MLVGFLALLWPWSRAVPLYNHLLAPATRLVMLPFDHQVEVYAEGDAVKMVRRIDNIKNPSGERYPFGLSLDTMRVTVDLPFLVILFLATPGLAWRRKAVLLAAGLALLFPVHVTSCWLNAMAASFQNGNLTVDLATGKIGPLGPNPWYDLIPHFQYLGAVVALVLWAGLVNHAAETCERKPT